MAGLKLRMPQEAVRSYASVLIGINSLSVKTKNGRVNAQEQVGQRLPPSYPIFAGPPEIRAASSLHEAR